MREPAIPQSFKKLALTRWIDLALYFPSRYENESQVWAIDQVTAGQFAQIQVSVVSSRILFRPRRMLLVEVEDATGRAMLRYLYFKDAQKNAFVAGHQIRVLGEARKSLAGLEFIHPRIRSGWMTAQAIESQPLVPVYPTASGISQAMLRRAVSSALSLAMPKEWLPDDLLRKTKLLDLPSSISLIHTPPADAQESGLLAELSQRQGPAWDRIRLDELLAQQIVFRRARALRNRERANPLNNLSVVDTLKSRLPFALTTAQERSWSEISADLAREVPMHRLLQGDVGSGKTVVAALAAAQAVGSGVQVAIMAPTEILAEQLFAKFSEWLLPLGISIALLKGGMPTAARKALRAQIESGEMNIVVGTHALIQKDVAFHLLGLAIVDEQHRFGVGQRLALRTVQTQVVPHLLGMSATPIPRSLAMTFLADLDVSVIDERPAHRKPIITKLMASARRDELVERLSAFLAQGGQAYWVCPVIDAVKPEEQAAENKKALQAIENTAQWLGPLFGDQLLVLHGRMSAQEKASAMQEFASGRRRLLLATTVIEVGVDVPKASLMVIEHAERFGLAQLHQLRGRVGRGAEQSTCILLFDEPLSDAAKERLKTLYETDDGFEVARRDLAIRGPGEFLGLRQSGIPSLRYCDLERDQRWVELAVQFGAKLAQAEHSPSQLNALGVTQTQLDELVDRWAFNREIFLSSG